MMMMNFDEGCNDDNDYNCNDVNAICDCDTSNDYDTSYDRP